VYHDEEAEPWIRAFDGEPFDWETLLNTYAATIDWPATAFWKELIEFYPYSKVVLTVRDSDECLKSFSAALRPIRRAALHSEFEHFPARLTPYLTLAARLAIREFDGELDDPEHMMTMYDKHNAEVREAVPDERFLVFEPSSGWNPLREFLGVAVPIGEKFSHVNGSVSFTKMVDHLTGRQQPNHIGVSAMTLPDR
jgi:hypothetical protein